MNNERYKYYRDIRLWPLRENLNYEQWLENFSDGEEKEIAQRILDFFIYIPDGMINQMLSTVIGKCGYIFKKKWGDSWSDEDFKNNCWYSLMPGEELSITDSGYGFNHKLKNIIHIPENRFVKYEELYQKLASSENQNVILVDDFVGSGHQAIVAWTREEDNNDKKRKSFQEIVIKNKHCVIYAPLIVNEMGYKLITSKCKKLNLVYIYRLDEKYSIFNKNCPCWNGDLNLYNKAVDLITNKSNMLGIPNDKKKPNYYKGYKKQGLAIAFEQFGMPDACPPFFYWETETWKPLIKKVYSRL
ncbi:MAG: hypothetical protein J5542_10095 [Bacteroidales bacterium]|nr:hypothetical protein [Bacteroidales bacterium]